MAWEEKDYFNEIYGWYSPFTRKTGAKLFNYMSIEHGSKVPPRGKTFVICWGARYPKKMRMSKFRKRIEGMDFLNHIDNINDNSDKLNSIMVFNNSGLASPKYATKEKVYEAIESGDLLLPVIGRKLHHQGGSGFFFCNEERDIERAIQRGAVYFLQYINGRCEFRVHVFKNKVLRVQRKYRKAGEEEVVRSRKRGWRLRNVSKHYFLPKGLKELAITAVNSLGLDFGGADILYGQDKQLYLLEVNTGVGLNRKGRKLYRRQFRREILKRFER